MIAGILPLVYLLYTLTKLLMKKSFSLAVEVCQ